MPVLWNKEVPSLPGPTLCRKFFTHNIFHQCLLVEGCYSVLCTTTSPGTCPLPLVSSVSTKFSFPHCVPLGSWRYKAEIWISTSFTLDSVTLQGFHSFLIIYSNEWLEAAPLSLLGIHIIYTSLMTVLKLFFLLLCFCLLYRFFLMWVNSPFFSFIRAYDQWFKRLSPLQNYFLTISYVCGFNFSSDFWNNWDLFYCRW